MGMMELDLFRHGDDCDGIECRTVRGHADRLNKRTWEEEPEDEQEARSWSSLNRERAKPIHYLGHPVTAADYWYDPSQGLLQIHTETTADVFDGDVDGLWIPADVWRKVRDKAATIEVALHAYNECLTVSVEDAHTFGREYMKEQSGTRKDDPAFYIPLDRFGVDK